MAVRALPIVFAALVSLPALLAAQTRAANGGWVETRGARVHVPDGWTYNDRLLSASGPLNMTNFGGAYASGGLLPPEGAEIEVTSVAAPPNLIEYVKKQLQAAKIDKLQEMDSGDKSGIRASYAQSFPGGASLKTVVSYVLHGAQLYKFYLSYWGGNRSEPSLMAVFDRVVKEAQLR